jgi:molybdopterin/thiamine biosynthesis adenylyltransferase
MPLTRLPAAVPVRSRTTLYAGGGGAIAHQVMWAEANDPILKATNRRSRIIVVDPKRVHESCRARQWAYRPEDLHGHKADCTQKWLQDLFPGADVVACHEKLKAEHLCGRQVEEIISSVDNWSGRKTISRLALKCRIPWFSTGSSFFGGFARCVDAANPYCASAENGIERLNERPDDGEQQSGTSCSAEETPMPSSVLPQMILGAFVACQRRAAILGTADPKVLAQGIEVHLTYGSVQSSYKHLRWGPGRMLNLKRKKQKGRVRV